MSDFQLSTPVAFLIFNRPDTTARVFDAIRQARPPKLFVIADGPRSNRPDDIQKCSDTRSIIEQIDWPCEVFANYADTNLGCKKRVSSGLTWVFERVPEAIILEDDCLPHCTFFRYCEEMLNHFRENKSIAHISGANFQVKQLAPKYSYYYSQYPHVWGWASWRRAWKEYDVNMDLWKSSRNKERFLDKFTTIKEKSFWKWTWEEVAMNRIDTWDYQWMFACTAAGYTCVTPMVNFVQNIGFGNNATHTNEKNKAMMKKMEGISFPLTHPSNHMIDRTADIITSRLFFSGPSSMMQLGIRMKRKLKGLFVE